MTYVFNTQTGRIVTGVGGGRIFVSEDRYGDRPASVSAQRTFDRLGTFLVEHPEGGVVTEIIEAHRKS